MGMEKWLRVTLHGGYAQPGAPGVEAVVLRRQDIGVLMSVMSVEDGGALRWDHVPWAQTRRRSLCARRSPSTPHSIKLV